jgi:hypothetical protein
VKKASLNAITTSRRTDKQRCMLLTLLIVMVLQDEEGAGNIFPGLLFV